MERNADVVVIGGGGAGMSAALFASSAGASVTLLEADSKLGGATALSDAVIYAAGTSVQRRLGIADSADAMYFYIMTLNAWQTRPDIIRILSDRSSEAIEWAMQLGVGFDWVAESGVDGVARGHCTNGGGAALCAALAAEMARHDIEVCLGVRAERLLTEGGAVTGVHADGVDYRAKAVVVTTGGFGNSPEMPAISPQRPSMAAGSMPSTTTRPSSWVTGSSWAKLSARRFPGTTPACSIRRPTSCPS